LSEFEFNGKIGFELKREQTSIEKGENVWH